MMARNFQSLSRWIGALLLAASSLIATSTQAINLTPLPPYLTETKGSPMVMLNLSRDHQLSYKAYNEFSDLDGDGTTETQYSHAYSYYGYFDNQRCYTYSTAANTYVPSRKVNSTTRYCNYGGAIVNEWSGNFLNWATMTRMDVVRRILYGGMRSTDSDFDGARARASADRRSRVREVLQQHRHRAADSVLGNQRDHDLQCHLPQRRKPLLAQPCWPTGHVGRERQLLPMELE